ncbi:MAG: GtrA family protein [Clostridia bacterium]|nr:GtrA family protein [Clostridia bacterium]
MEKIRTLYGRYRRIVHYVFFGGVATIVNIASFWAGKRLGMATWAANALAWIIAVLVAYYTNRRWVFESRNRGAEAIREFLSFVGCRLATFALDEAIMILGVDRLGPAVTFVSPKLWELFVKVFANILVLILNYVFSRLFIFRKREG